MKDLLKILKNYRFVKRDFFLYIFFGLLLQSLYLFYPQFAKILISIIENKGDLNELYFWGTCLALFTITITILSFTNAYFSNRLWLYSYSRKMQYCKEAIFNKNYKDILGIGTGKLITRIKSGVDSEIDIFKAIVDIFIQAIYRGILVIIILSLLIPKLIFAVIIGITLLVGINFYLRNYIKKYNKIEQELREDESRHSAKIIMENLVIRIFGKVKYENKQSKKVLEKVPGYGVRVHTANNFFYQLLETLLKALEIGVYIIIGTLIIKEGNLEISYLIMLTGYIWFLWWPLDQAVSNINTINKAWEKYKKLDEFLELKVEIKNGKKKYKYDKGEIEISDLNFSYGKEKAIFKGLNLKFLKGKRNALVGHSGGGKSTIIKILLRLYDYQAGKIEVDGQDLKKLKIESFYSNVGYLPQDPGVFDGTIRENLEYAFDNKKSDEKLIWEALKKAQIADMVKGLEKGLETEVGEKGIKLSGGEKQRLAIARIFIKNPKIIILDEPTSALDSISESKINKALDVLLKGKTSIIIAHRLQTVMYSDKITVLENGKVESEGSHKELMKSSKTYKELVDLQNGKVNE